MTQQDVSPTKLASEESVDMATKPVSVKKEILHLWKGFAEVTTLHGCRNVQDSDKSVFFRVIWALIVISMFLVLIISLTMLWIQYSSFPFKTVWNLSRETSIPLPAITLCLYADFDRGKTASWKDSRQYVDDRWSFSNLSSNEFVKLNYSEAQQLFGFNARDVILAMFASDIQDIHFLSLSDWVVSEPDPGRACWTIHNSDNRGSVDEKFDFKLEISSSFFLFLNPMKARVGIGYHAFGVEIFLHEAGSRYWLQKGMNIMPGVYADVQLIQEKTKFLPSPYNSAGSKGCVDTDDPGFVNPLRFFEAYSIDLCITELLVNESQKRCGCAFQPHASLLRVKECTVIQFQQCYVQVRNKVLREALLTSNKQCLDPCHTNRFTTSITTSALNVKSMHKFLLQNNYTFAPDLEMKDLILVQIYPMSMDVTTMEHVPEVTLLEVYAQVGGFMGLFLGASLITLMELADVALFIAWAAITSIVRRVR
ncbi:acid-sensing ion channel 1-like [Plakobranchus ocellatus]|uniref:Acid-sensing ion channel 1-like n=1 Tax=Plakobranchus ocellatus TaxID=259542 RepID=A0AAV4CJR7_9GAST|nr:acid-sensing ion channel 1-like [Plakobranchus ocellatus]